jgi:putative endonuclease
MRVKDSLDRHGEEIPVAHLQALGKHVLERNWRCQLGEIDVVALDGDCLVVCEVKTRRTLAAGVPLEAVTHPGEARPIETADVGVARRAGAAFRGDQDRRHRHPAPRRWPAPIDLLEAVG